MSQKDLDQLHTFLIDLASFHAEQLGGLEQAIKLVEKMGAEND